MPFKPFVPLRVLSAYSMLEGAIEPKAMAKLAKERGFPAIALADRNGLYGAVMFAKACFDEGIQPIVGALLGVARDAEGKQVDYLPLYAQDETGYDNLCHLVSKAHLDRPLEFEPHIGLGDLEGHSEGLIALTGASEGGVTRLLADGQVSHAESYLERLQALFPERLYIELARRGNAVEEGAEAALIDLAFARDLPLVATNPANFAEPHMYKAHDAMLCIAGSTHIDAEDRARSNPEGFVKTASMMAEAFADLPEATANTLVIAQRCAYAPPNRAPILPSLAGDLEGESRMLAEDARRGLAARLALYYPDASQDELAEALAATGEARKPAIEALGSRGVGEEFTEYAERLEFEVGIIN